VERDSCPDVAAVEAPVDIVIVPETPDGPLFADSSTTSPLDDWVLKPLRKVKVPPVPPVVPARSPPTRETDPPLPASPCPAKIDTEPAIPEVPAAVPEWILIDPEIASVPLPDARVTAPEPPDCEAPDVREIAPLSELESADSNETSPLEVEELDPERIKIMPPDADAALPPSRLRSPPGIAALVTPGPTTTSPARSAADEPE
jgi:hypothetical protein